MQVGFLMTFCESQYCTENIRFIVAVAKYKLLFKQDGIRWLPFEEVDKLDEHVAMIVNNDKIREIEKDIKFIISSFLDPSAKLEICMPTKVASNTFRRIEEWKAYGPDVFDEAVLDPKVTLNRDIMPRFVVSSVYNDMKFFLYKINKLPSMTGLKLPTITASQSVIEGIVATLKTDDLIRDYVNCIDNFFIDPLLYNQLLKFLTRIVSSESLLCIRAVDMYHGLFEEIETKKLRIMDGSTFSTIEMNQLAQVVELSGEIVVNTNANSNANGNKTKSEQVIRGRIIGQAWQIYLHFVAPDSCFEVGISHKLMQSVNRNMAAPTGNMFDGLRITALKCLADHFSTTFKSSPCYTQLLQLVKTRELNFQDEMDSPGASTIGCFGTLQYTASI
mgnify:CR=1 FL=1